MPDETEHDGDKTEPESEPPAGAPPGWRNTELLRGHLRRIERLLDPGVRLIEDAGERFVVPAWERVTQGEPRWPVSLAIVAALAMQVTLPAAVIAHPRWFLPTLAGLLLVGIVASNPRRIDRESRNLRVASVALIGVLSAANAWSAIKLVRGLALETVNLSASRLLLAGGAIWLTNVVVFALWYWELDRGGPAARSHALEPYPDFLFPQMESPELAPPDWEAGFVDYLYLSFTNGTAFSPTDVLPLSRWAKLTMMLQSAVSLSTVALVIARAVNLFPTKP